MANGRRFKEYPKRDLRKTATLIKKELLRVHGHKSSFSLNDFLRARFRVHNKTRRTPEAFQPIMSTRRDVIYELRDRITGA